MPENLMSRLTNCNSALMDIYRDTPDEELKAEINNIRCPIMIMLAELELFPAADSVQVAEEALIEAMLRIKKIQEEIAGAATMRSADLITKTP